MPVPLREDAAGTQSKLTNNEVEHITETSTDIHNILKSIYITLLSRYHIHH